jgi:DnaJ-class molecular chaperone
MKEKPLLFCVKCHFVLVEYRSNEMCPHCYKTKRRGVFSSAFNVNDWKGCPRCEGTGKANDKECAHCNGVGWLLVRDGQERICWDSSSTFGK